MDRMNRLPYFLWNLAFAFGAICLEAMLYSPQYPHGAPGVQGLLTIVGFVLGVKRMHDLDRSGWWLLAPWGVILTVACIIGLFAWLGAGEDVTDTLWALGAIVMIGSLLAQWIYLYLIPGTKGPNRFGPDPKDRRANFAPAE